MYSNIQSVSISNIQTSYEHSSPSMKLVVSDMVEKGKKARLVRHNSNSRYLDANKAIKYFCSYVKELNALPDTGFKTVDSKFL